MDNKFFYPEVYPESNCIVISTVYGPVICNRADSQATALLQTGKARYASDITRLSFFLNHAPDRAICLDVGSSYGLFGLAFARALSSKKGTCHSFDAQRMTAYMAAGTAFLNGIENLYVHHRSIGDASEKETTGPIDTEKAQRSGTSDNGGQVRSAQDLRFENPIRTSIDNLKLTKVYLIRVSVDGMEKAVLEGAQATINRDKPILYVRADQSDGDQLAQFCKNLEYQVHRCSGYFLCVHRSEANNYNILNSKAFSDALI